MALLTSEIERIKFELGYSNLTHNADPYISIVAYFETIVADWLEAGATTTSSTSVNPASPPAPVTLTLASATGFTAQDRIIVDVGIRQEEAFIQSVSGSTIAVILQNVHSGTYPVTVEGGETIVRMCLRRIDEANAQRGSMVASIANGQIRKVDEVEFFKASNSVEQSAKELDRQVSYWRNQIASALGVTNMHNYRVAAGSSVSVY